jgi:hypothetical protein
VLILKQTGTELSGSGGPNLQRQLPMLKGAKVATTKDATTATFTIADETLSLAFDLKMVDGKLKGSVKGTKGDETRTGVAEFERAKAPRP